MIKWYGHNLERPFKESKSYVSKRKDSLVFSTLILVSTGVADMTSKVGCLGMNLRHSWL